MSEKREIPGFPRYYADTDGNIYGRKGTILRAGLCCNGYASVKLPCPDRTLERKTVHRLVVMTFIGPIPPKMQVNHKNGIRNDNRLENLEIVTPSQNARHAIDVLGRLPIKGSQNGMSVLNDESVRAIRFLLKSGWSQARVARAFKVKGPTISNIHRGVYWSHLEEPAANPEQTGG